MLPELVLGLAAPHGLRTATLAVSPFWESGAGSQGSRLRPLQKLACG